MTSGAPSDVFLLLMLRVPALAYLQSTLMFQEPLSVCVAVYELRDCAERKQPDVHRRVGLRASTLRREGRALVATIRPVIVW